MTSPEKVRQHEMHFAIETRRALERAEIVASKQNTNIGIGALFIGVFNEMGNPHAASVLQRNGINIDQFNRNLQLATEIEGVNKSTNAEPRLSDLCEMAIRDAVDHARSKRIKELLPSDLLLGISRAVNVVKIAAFISQQATAGKLIRERKQDISLIKTIYNDKASLEY